MPPFPDFVTVEQDWLEEGPTAIECLYDEAISVPPLLERVKKAAADEVDGIVIGCFMDPGLRAARELVRVPVAGLAESAMLLAGGLGQSFSVILPARSGIPKVVDQAISYGVRDRLASVPCLEIPLSEYSDREKLVRETVKLAERALKEDDAHTLIMGCTGMSPVTEAVKRELHEHGHDVPVIDPIQAAVGMLLAHHTMGVTHSLRAYALPSWRT